MSDAQPLQSKKSGPLKGLARVPGDKSISHRALMFSALADGESMISGLLEGEDVLCTAAAMRTLGASVEKSADGLWRVAGIGNGTLKTPDKPLDMGNSGTSARLLMGVVAGYPVKANFTGDASLTKRPMNRVMKPLEMMGATFEASEGGRLPLTINGVRPAKAITYEMPVASAQVKSAILLAGLNAPGVTTVIEDKPTRDHTEKMLQFMGVDVTTETLEDGRFSISITGGQTLQPGAIDVPSDPSSAAFPAVAALLHEGSDITLPRIAISERRIGLYTTLREMGAAITFENIHTEAGEKIADLRITTTSALKSIEVPPERAPSMIDEFPILAVAAACAEGTTHMTGLAELRVKESDRLLMMAEGLKACGVDLEMGEDSLTIHGTGKPPKGGATIKTALDHRIAMSFLVLGSVTDEPVQIDDGAPIRTSFPNFVELMNELGAKIGPA